MKKKIIGAAFIAAMAVAFCLSCNQNKETEKFQYKRDNIIHVRGMIKEIPIENVLINNNAWPYSIGRYLIICDYRSVDKLMHIFDKKDYSYVSSIAKRGGGPGEISRIGHIEFNQANNQLYVTDHGKQKIFSYDLDSAIITADYQPKEKMKISETLFPDKYVYVNDTLSIGTVIAPIGASDFKPSLAKWNMNTGEITPMKYEHPKVEKKRTVSAVSMKYGLYVECYCNYDLMTIGTLEGNLQCNVYGQDWENRRTSQTFYGDVAFCRNRIVTLYSGENKFSEDKKYVYPTKILIFDTNGAYIKTLETGYQIVRFCYDEERNRIIMSLNDEIQFAYLDLDDILINTTL